MKKKLVLNLMTVILATGLLFSLAGPRPAVAWTPALDGPFVISPDAAPTAVADDYECEAGTTLSVPISEGVLANDSDPDGDPLTAVLVGDVAFGTLLLNSNGSFEYTPEAGYVGTDHFTYRADDGTSQSTPAQVSIEVTSAGNTAPTAVADEYEVDAGTTLTVTAPGVLANDTDPEDDPLTAEWVAGPSNGNLTFSPDGSFVYTPDVSYIGADHFTYRAFDGLEESDPAMVTINVVSEGDTVPVAVADEYETQVDITLTVNITDGVLANDTDADGDTLTAILVGDASSGALTLYPDGSFVYLPDAAFAGTDRFIYKASDGVYESTPVMVTINVVGEADAVPVAVADTYETDVDIKLTVNITDGVLANDSDADGDPLTAQLLSDVTQGSLVLNADGSFEYTPDPGYIGDDHFTYQAFDGLYTSAPTMVTINVVSEGSAPVAVADTYEIYTGTLLTVDAATGVLANDSDADDDTLTAQLTANPSFGTLTLNPDGSFTYMPNRGFVGTDHFTYVANDGLYTSNPVMVTINVIVLNSVRLPIVVK